MVTNAPDTQMQQQTQTQSEDDGDPIPHLDIKEVDPLDTPLPSTPESEHEGKKTDRRQGEDCGREGEGEDEGGGPSSSSKHHTNGWSNYGPPNTLSTNSNPPPSRSHSRNHAPQEHPERGVGQPHLSREPQENVVLRRGFVPRTAPERMAQRKSSMAQLQQWVNQRRGMASQEDINRYICQSFCLTQSYVLSFRRYFSTLQEIL